MLGKGGALSKLPGLGKVGGLLGKIPGLSKLGSLFGIGGGGAVTLKFPSDGEDGGGGGIGGGGGRGPWCGEGRA